METSWIDFFDQAFRIAYEPPQCFPLFDRLLRIEPVL